MQKSFFSSVDLLLVHLIGTALLTGLIWSFQIVYFPSMAGWREESFGDLQTAGLLHTGFLLMPLMLFEGISAGLLLMFRPRGVPAWCMWVGVGLIAGIWLSSSLIQYAVQARLALGWDPQTHAELVDGNWVRTVLWTVRLVLVTGALRLAVAQNSDIYSSGTGTPSDARTPSSSGNAIASVTMR